MPASKGWDQGPGQGVNEAIVLGRVGQDRPPSERLQESFRG